MRKVRVEKPQRDSTWKVEKPIKTILDHRSCLCIGHDTEVKIDLDTLPLFYVFGWHFHEAAVDDPTNMMLVCGQSCRFLSRGSPIWGSYLLCLFICIKSGRINLSLSPPCQVLSWDVLHTSTTIHIQVCLFIGSKIMVFEGFPCK